LAAHPQYPLALSEIARTLAINNSSCHATLTLLADRNFLIRHSDKTYSLGPAILPIANSFLHDQDALYQARIEMAAVSRELELDCLATSAVDDEIIVLATTSSPKSFGISSRVGSRFSFVPPVGTVFLAWAGEERIERWLRGLGEGRGVAAKRERCLDALAVVRERGYSVAIDRNGAGLEPRLGRDDHLLFDLRERQSLTIAHVAAPVFDPEGTVRLALTVVAFHNRLAPQDVPPVAERLRVAAARVAKDTWGLDEHNAADPRAAARPEQAEGAVQPSTTDGVAVRPRRTSR
jgi:DNA-binding IclR family transcriptional regulator